MQLLSMNFFEIFGLPVDYKIDETALLRAYLREQAAAHPDVADGESEKSTRLNVAYKVLRDPVERAGYLLELRGKNPDALDTEFAAEMFDIREKYEAAANAGSDGDRIVDELVEKKTRLISELHDLSDNSDEFQKKYNLLRFLNSFLKKIEIAD
jgi:molecular chaperone HscB